METPESINVGSDLLEAAQRVIDEAATMSMTRRRRKIFDNLASALSRFNTERATVEPEAPHACHEQGDLS
jgi:hypothetical protein